jgi:hypothetical protein
MIHAKYTEVLKNLMDDPAAKAAIDKALSTYPLYKPEKVYDLVPDREELNNRLLNHYKYREIGFETVGRFLDELKVTMCEIMPRYNELLKTVVTMAELPSPFDNVDVVETFDETRKTESTSDTKTGTETGSTSSNETTTNNTVDSTNKHVRSTTPQGNISIPADKMETVNHADEVQWGKDHSGSEGTSTSEGYSSATSSGNTNIKNDGTETVTHTHTKKGNQGVNTYAHDMLEFRTAIIDVVDQIIHDPRINELFMLVY